MKKAAIEPSIFVEPVKKGMALLDEKLSPIVPSWSRGINVDELRTELSTTCTVGQLFGEGGKFHHLIPEGTHPFMVYERALAYLGVRILDSHLYGFYHQKGDSAAERSAYYAVLDATWKSAISARNKG